MTRHPSRRRPAEDEGDRDLRPPVPTDLTQEGCPREAFTRLLQFVASHGWRHLDHGQCRDFFLTHNGHIYDVTSPGPWSQYRKTRPEQTQRKFVQAFNARIQVLEHAGEHSGDSRAAGERLPQDLMLLCDYQRYRASNPSASIQAERGRQHGRSIERSVVGAQPPLGPDNNELRTQTSANNIRAGPSS